MERWTTWLTGMLLAAGTGFAAPDPVHLENSDGWERLWLGSYEERVDWAQLETHPGWQATGIGAASPRPVPGTRIVWLRHRLPELPGRTPFLLTTRCDFLVDIYAGRQFVGRPMNAIPEYLNPLASKMTPQLDSWPVRMLPAGSSGSWLYLRMLWDDRMMRTLRCDSVATGDQAPLGREYLDLAFTYFLTGQILMFGAVAFFISGFVYRSLRYVGYGLPVGLLGAFSSLLSDIPRILATEPAVFLDLLYGLSMTMGLALSLMAVAVFDNSRHRQGIWNVIWQAVLLPGLLVPWLAGWTDYFTVAYWAVGLSTPGIILLSWFYYRVYRERQPYLLVYLVANLVVIMAFLSDFIFDVQVPGGLPFIWPFSMYVFLGILGYVAVDRQKRLDTERDREKHRYIRERNKLLEQTARIQNASLRENTRLLDDLSQELKKKTVRISYGDRARLLLLYGGHSGLKPLRSALAGCGMHVEIVGPAEEPSSAAEDYDLVLFGPEFLDAGKAIARRGRSKAVLILDQESRHQDDVLWSDHPWLDNIIFIDRSDETFTQKIILGTISKMMTDNIYGIEKYLNWGVALQEFRVEGSRQRQEIIDILAAFLEETGIRRRIRSDALIVADEMMMNAIFSAPRDAGGLPVYEGIDRRGDLILAPDEQALLRFGFDGTWLALSVEDPFGSINRQTILEYVAHCTRNKNPEALHGHGGKTGGGTGIYSIIHRSDLVIVNVTEDERTEFIALLRVTGRSGRSGKGLHYFKRDAA